MSLFFREKSKLGIDIGTSSIKVVQLKKEEEKQGHKLETFGVVNVANSFGRTDNFNAIEDTAEIVKALLKKSSVTAKDAVVSLPSGIVFVTMIEMPKLSEKELKKAIEFEARRYVPLPLEEVTMSWSVLETGSDGDQQKILLTAVPTNVIENYMKMLKAVNVKPEALEIEALALIRSLVGDRKENVIIVDIGGRNTSLNLVESGFLRVSRNLLVGGETITASIAQGLKVSDARAEQFKRDLGLTRELVQQIPQAMKPPLDRIKNETTQLLKIFESSGRTIAEIIFTGNGSKIPGLLKYFIEIGPKVSLGDPLKFINFSDSAKTAVEKNSLSLSVALGLAMRE